MTGRVGSGPSTPGKSTSTVGGADPAEAAGPAGPAGGDPADVAVTGVEVDAAGRSDVSGGVLVMDLRRHNTLLVGHDRYFLLHAGGRVQLVRDLCPHRGGPLSLARRTPDDRRLRCPWHGTRVGIAAVCRTSLPMVRTGSEAAVVLPESAREVPVTVIRRRILANLPPDAPADPTAPLASAGRGDTTDGVGGDSADSVGCDSADPVGRDSADSVGRDSADRELVEAAGPGARPAGAARAASQPSTRHV